MTKYVLRRVLQVIPVMAVVLLFVFLLVRIVPGDPAAIMAGDYATEENIQRIREALGINEPLHVQFGKFVWNIVRGELGNSLHSGQPVMKLIRERAECTVVLSVTVLMFAVSIAVPMGVLAAWKAGSFIDRAGMVFSVAGFSLPVFWMGLMMIYQFSVELRWLPVQGYVSYSEDLREFASHLVLPTISLGIVYMALLTRMTRASMLEVLHQDYIRTAFAKGLDNRSVLFTHALKNAAVPIVTTIGVSLGLLIHGVVIAETVFALPGVGRLTVDAVLQRDYSIIQGVTLLFSFVYVMINLLVDLSYTLFDPRIRY